MAVRAVSRLGLCYRLGHLDATGFHVDGEYNSGEILAEDSRVIQITPGYSRDHRPDLNQVVLQLIAERQAGIPLLMEALDGNNSDKSSFRETVKAYMDQLNHEVGLEYLIADSALYTADTLGEMNGFYWITRVLETLDLARFLIQATAPDLMKNRGASEFHQCRNPLRGRRTALGHRLLAGGLSAGDKNRGQGVAETDLSGIKGLRSVVPTDLFVRNGCA